MEEAEAVGGDAAEANRLLAAQPLGHGLERRLAPDFGAEAVGDDHADVIGQRVQREVVPDPKVEAGRNGLDSPTTWCRCGSRRARS